MSLYHFHVLKRAKKKKKNALSAWPQDQPLLHAGQEKGSIKGVAICLPQTAGETRKAN